MLNSFLLGMTVATTSPLVDTPTPSVDDFGARSGDGAISTNATTNSEDLSALLGCWDLTIDLPFPVGKKDALLCFEQRDETLRARLKLRGKWKQAQSLRVTNHTAKFVVQGPNGTVTFTTHFANNQMQGHAEGKLGKRPCTGKKR